MTPMIDVVFLLIIFFLVSSHLAKQESRPPLQLPVAGQQAIASAAAEYLTVNVHFDQTVSVGGAVVDAQRLAFLLRRHAEDHRDLAAIRIRIDRDIPYAQAEPLLHDAALAGITRIVFAVREDQVN
jgi:biopolymer transport protein ExbD